MDELIAEGRALFAYEISGQYDQNEMQDEIMDGVWCSIYDVLKLASFEIIDPLDPEDFKEAYAYLKKGMASTIHHQNDVFEFEEP